MGLAHHSGGPSETFPEELSVGLVEGVGAAGSACALAHKSLSIYEGMQSRAGPVPGRSAARLVLWSPQSWQVALQGGGQQMPHGMEHCFWRPGQGHAQAHSSCCLQNTVVWGPPLPRFLICWPVYTSLTASSVDQKAPDIHPLRPPDPCTPLGLWVQPLHRAQGQH